MCFVFLLFFFFPAEDGIRDLVRSRGLGDVYKRQLQTGNGPALFLAGTIITCVTAFTTLWVGYKVLKIPMGLLTGILAGLQTQPTVLGFAQEQTHNELPNIGYATVYPVAMITKILLAQVILILFL